jgi:hypothetical protein
MLSAEGTPASLVIVGNPGPEHVGHHLLTAAREIGLPVSLCDSGQAYQAPGAVAKLNWMFRGHRPSRLGSFSRSVLRECTASGATSLITTGLAPVNAETIAVLGGHSGGHTMARINFLTDDPWNPAHAAPWFMRALPRYDFVFSPRRANLADLRAAGCTNVSYLPFGYAPAIHFPEPPASPAEAQQYDSDVVFAGGADSERLPYMAALIRAGIRLALYGGYWGNHPETRAFSRGHASAPVLRKAVGGARIALCLVRRANRDGHAMRTFELAAMGACVLAEDTEEHREILGPDGTSAVYFRSPEEMVGKTRELLTDEGLRGRMALAVRQRILATGNTYRDRLVAMLGLAGIS